jgi:regulation of enolase protein 1 (concanavalin A-like superfamily)
MSAPELSRAIIERAEQLAVRVTNANARLRAEEDAETSRTSKKCLLYLSAACPYVVGSKHVGMFNIFSHATS